MERDRTDIDNIFYSAASLLDFSEEMKKRLERERGNSITLKEEEKISGCSC